MKEIIELASEFLDYDIFAGERTEEIMKRLKPALAKRKELEATPITEEWLKEHGWGVHHHDKPYDKLFHFAIKVIGKDHLIINDRRELKIFRDYNDGDDVYADVLIDNIETVAQLYDACELCGINLK